MKKIVLGSFLLLSQFCFAEDAAVKVQDKLNAIRTMSASFSQVVKAKKKQVSRSSGTMALSRPGKFRWQTKSPMPQLVVADGNRLWVYDVDLEQVTVKKQQKGIGGTAGLFLSGYDDTVNRDFNVTESSKGNLEYFDLKAKSSKANFQRVKLIFEGETLKGMELFDQLGQHTHVTLSNIKTNPSLSSSLFKFKAPKGVDVVQQ
ncbi:Outer-membrane lipoprotein carrier protein precursor (plasmid) [Legionella adelaidensis]|uniref:Outer-membrane lipoprotein carrier protein n=1 Tax=Legionella adelaidensis TaxID=45056 RepID=A0A0W0R356_9GAMM|nr:outer membrane lipoprotein chaperone LolA [Legionella adelaidensis]KTC65504.1 Outer-membrane lipoprotein carrier protein precursor [Legionella adelaidensis]VEH84675.1 Outer-membrane lipoprotein carrier protein precursor [Legionella adelaidensis]